MGLIDHISAQPRGIPKDFMDEKDMDICYHFVIALVLIRSTSKPERPGATTN
jgi:hypothetical protein